jgi:hypothetical protein
MERRRIKEGEGKKREKGRLRRVKTKSGRREKGKGKGKGEGRREEKGKGVSEHTGNDFPRVGEQLYQPQLVLRTGPGEDLQGRQNVEGSSVIELLEGGTFHGGT